MNVYDFYITPEEYNTAQENGISRELLNRRIRALAWDKKSAMTKEPRRHNDIKDYLDKAAKNGIKKHTFLSRIGKLGWDFEKAAITPTKDNKENMRELAENHRKYPLNVLEKVKSNNIRMGTFYARIKKGWSMDKAAETHTLNQAEVSRRGNEAYCKIYGKSFGAYL